MSGSHEVPKNLDNKLKLGLVLNTGFTIFEFAIGISSGSLALVSDAGHNLTDSLTLLISFFAQRIAKREATSDHSYGYGRATILSALINGMILFLLALFIFYEAYGRLMHPTPVEGGIVMAVAFVGLLINGTIAWIFKGEQKDLNIRSAYVNMLYDALASVGAFGAGLLIVITKQTFFDPLISIIIGVMLLRSSWYVVRDATHVLLEGIPEGVNMQKVKNAIRQIENVKAVDDIHIWAISSHFAALSCHVVIENCTLNQSIELVKQIKEELHEKFNIEHATIETELIACPPEKE